MDHFNRLGGAQFYLLDLIRAFSEKPDYQVFYSKPKKPSFLPWTKNLKNANPVPFLLKGNAGLISFFMALVWLPFWVKKNKINFIHVNSMPALIAAFFISRKDLFFTCHDFSHSKIKRRILRVIFPKTISVSHAIQDYVKKNKLGRPMGVVSNGFFVQEFLKTKLRFPQGLTLGIVGRIEKWKGHLLFIEVLGDLKKNGTPVQGILFGYSESNKFLEQIKREIKNRDLESHVRIDSFEKDQSKIFEKMSILINASIEPEPFGRTIVESGLFGVPAIGPNRAGPKEIIRNGETGFVFDQSEDLFEIILKFVNEPQLAETLGQKAKRIYEGEYDINKILNELEAIYLSQ